MGVGRRDPPRLVQEKHQYLGQDVPLQEPRGRVADGRAGAAAVVCRVADRAPIVDSAATTGRQVASIWLFILNVIPIPERAATRTAQPVRANYIDDFQSGGQHTGLAADARFRAGAPAHAGAIGRAVPAAAVRAPDRSATEPDSAASGCSILL